MGTYRTLAVAALLLLAGCSGLFPGEDGPKERTPYGVEDELDPAAAGNESNGTDPATIAPGLTTAGVENDWSLVDAHYEALEAASGNGTYVATIRETVVAENGSRIRERRSRIVVDSADRRYRWDWVSQPAGTDPSVIETWIGDGERLVRVDRPNGSIEYRRTASPDPDRPLERTVQSLVRVASDAAVEELSENASTWYRVTANVSSVDGASDLAFTVRDDGLLNRISYAYESSHDSGDEYRGEFELSFETAGPDALERPDWYEEALEETGNETPNEGADDDSASDEPSTNDSASQEPSDDGSADEASDDESSTENSVRKGGRSVVRERTKR